MIYYVNDNKLISSDIPIEDSSFVKITKEDYEARLVFAQQYREQGVETYENMESEVEVW